MWKHLKSEWSRMAVAAYASACNEIGHRYSMAASIPEVVCNACGKEYEEVYTLTGYTPGEDGG